MDDVRRMINRSISIFTDKHIAGEIYIYTYVCTHNIYIQTDRQTCMHAYKHTYIHTYIHSYIHMHTHTFIHTFIHTHTYVHT